VYLLDTNILLELLLDQAQADAVERLLRQQPAGHLHLTDFSLFSIGIVLFREKSPDLYADCLNDLIVAGGLRLVRLTPSHLLSLPQIAKQFRLDFDDAYQDAAAVEFGLDIVSFDTDFDCTTKGRKTPQQVCP
jgi:predicted nucleic acid-binding protein